jgi:hypothetical protein
MLSSSWNCPVNNTASIILMISFTMLMTTVNIQTSSQDYMVQIERLVLTHRPLNKMSRPPGLNRIIVPSIWRGYWYLMTSLLMSAFTERLLPLIGVVRFHSRPLECL